MNRNASCFCGSGKRLKHCCGRGAQAVPPARSLALAAHRAGSLRLAESQYRRVLDENAADVDALHMLGVVQLQQLRYREALDLILEAAERSAWALPAVRHNLGLVLSKLLVRGVAGREASLGREFREWEQSRGLALTHDRPLVTVVLPAFNHARFVAQAISSVAAQTYANVELIIIDDGSNDGTANVIAGCIASMSIPVRFIARANRGAPATLNEGAVLARGKYLTFLNSDDYYAPNRIAMLVDGIARAGLAWGFSLVASGSGAQQAFGAGEVASAGSYWQLQRALLGSESNSFALVQSNVAVSTGNLFVAREFFLALGGFREFRYNHDWDFCVRAAALAEPMVVKRILYYYRLHAGNTIRESPGRPVAEANGLLGDLLAATLSGDTPCANPFAPQWPGNRTLLLARIMGVGMGALVPIAVMQDLAAQIRASLLRVQRPTAAAALPSRRTAVVVLGMHRSGTSALARVLNLSGAYLPAELRPPDLYRNPTGFWESEAIINVNERALGRLGGAWNQVDLSPPAGDFVEEFMSDVLAVLASEYAEQPTILIKDPRICVLAQLWHQALTRAGYRTAYVVPIRDPLEVAQSLHARGDMTVLEGLALWLTYMRRVVEFTESVSGVVYVRFADLLDDWRRVVGRVTDGLGVALDARARADDVDRFLEPSLRRQRAGVDALDALPTQPLFAEVRALHRVCLARCEADVNAESSFLAHDGDRRHSFRRKQPAVDACGAPKDA